MNDRAPERATGRPVYLPGSRLLDLVGTELERTNPRVFEARAYTPLHRSLRGDDENWVCLAYDVIQRGLVEYDFPLTPSKTLATYGVHFDVFTREEAGVDVYYTREGNQVAGLECPPSSQTRDSPCLIPLDSGTFATGEEVTVTVGQASTTKSHPAF